VTVIPSAVKLLEFPIVPSPPFPVKSHITASAKPLVPSKNSKTIVARDKHGDLIIPP
jgi:hypothetical protein